MTDTASQTPTDFDAALGVMAARLKLLGEAASAPTRAHQLEIMRMVAEKQIAFMDGLVEAQCAVNQALVEMWAHGATPQALAALPHIWWSAFQAPALLTLSRNAKRLSGE